MAGFDPTGVAAGRERVENGMDKKAKVPKKPKSATAGKAKPDTTTRK